MEGIYPRSSTRRRERFSVLGKRIMPIDVEEVVASTPGLGEEYQNNIEQTR